MLKQTSYSNVTKLISIKNNMFKVHNFMEYLSNIGPLMSISNMREISGYKLIRAQNLIKYKVSFFETFKNRIKSKKDLLKSIYSNSAISSSDEELYDETTLISNKIQQVNTNSKFCSAKDEYFNELQVSSSSSTNSKKHLSSNNVNTKNFENFKKLFELDKNDERPVIQNIQYTNIYVVNNEKDKPKKSLKQIFFNFNEETGKKNSLL